MHVTIGIPCYKQAEFLSEAIESALAQTIPCEVIVVNDGSPDNTEEIAKKYPVKLINQVNKGLPSARNTAIMNMQGDYFLPLDADDKLLPLCVERLLHTAQTTNADIIAPSFETFGVAHDTVVLMPEPSLKDFLSGNRIAYFSMMKKEALLEVGGYSPRMYWGWEDYHLWFNLLSRGKKLVTLREILVMYRTKQDSMWHESIKHDKELWQQIFKDFPQIIPSEILTV